VGLFYNREVGKGGVCGRAQTSRTSGAHRGVSVRRHADSKPEEGLLGPRVHAISAFSACFVAHPTALKLWRQQGPLLVRKGGGLSGDQAVTTCQLVNQGGRHAQT
jgi:hypothetical protein